MPLVLKGNYTTKAGNIIPIEYDFNEDAEIVALANDLTIDGKNNLIAQISLHLNKLLSNVTAQEIDQTVRTNNMILITSTINPIPTNAEAGLPTLLHTQGLANYRRRQPTLKRPC